MIERVEQPWTVELMADWHWKVTANPYGQGLALLIERGIACEQHTQIVSRHNGYTPGKHQVQKAVDQHDRVISERINSFVEFMRAHDGAWEFKESIGLLFAHELLGCIITWSMDELNEEN